MRAALGFAACQSKKGNTLIIRLLPFQGGWRCGDIMLTQGDALPFIHIFCSLKSLEFCIFVR